MSLHLRPEHLLQYEIVRYWRLVREHEEEPDEVIIPTGRVRGKARAVSGAYDRIGGTEVGGNVSHWQGGGPKA